MTGQVDWAALSAWNKAQAERYIEDARKAWESGDNIHMRRMLREAAVRLNCSAAQLEVALANPPSEVIDDTSHELPSEGSGGPTEERGTCRDCDGRGHQLTNSYAAYDDICDGCGGSGQVAQEGDEHVSDERVPGWAQQQRREDAEAAAYVKKHGLAGVSQQMADKAVADHNEAWTEPQRPRQERIPATPAGSSGGSTSGGSMSITEVRAGIGLACDKASESLGAYQKAQSDLEQAQGLLMQAVEGSGQNDQQEALALLAQAISSTTEVQQGVSAAIQAAEGVANRL